MDEEPDAAQQGVELVMADESFLLFTGTTGINMVVDPTSVAYDPQSGVSDLIYGVNIEISQNRCVERTDGYSLLQSGLYHSLFCDGGDCFVGSGSNLYAVNTDWSLKQIASGMTGNPISYCQVADTTYYANGTNNGSIYRKKAGPWTTNDPAVVKTRRTMFPVPVGNHLAFAFGRIFFTVGNLLCWTELGLFGLWSPTVNNVAFGSKILMIKPVSEGMFVSTSSNTWLCRGPSRSQAGRDPHDWTLQKVAPYPAYEWSDAIDYVEGLEVGGPPGPAALWNSPEGACLGAADGTFYNLTRQKIIYPKDGRQGASLLRGFQFINSIL